HAGARQGRLDQGRGLGAASCGRTTSRGGGTGLRISETMLARPSDEELDAGPRRIAPGTRRFCAATGTVKPVAEMIRFVVSPVVGLLHAAEAAPDGGRKLASALRRRFADNADRVPVINTLTSAQLDLALGRPNVIHAALLKGPASETFLTRVARLDHFRADGP